MANSKGYSDEYRGVIHEDRVRVEGKSKAPDYAFRIGGIRKFQLEAKKPSVNIANDGAAAFQIRRYAWSAKLNLCVLTNFESLAIYDAAAKPVNTDSAKKARAKFYSYAAYETKWDEIYGLLSPEGIQKGNFSKFAANAGTRRGSTTIDNQFLEEIESWRSALAIDIASNNRGLDIRALNQAVQVLIDRIVFLRIAEDRGIEKYGRLKDAATKAHIYKRLVESFMDADRRYNSGLFHLIKQHPMDADVDEVAPNLKISDGALKPIIDGLYYPDSPYEFSEMPADVLGQVYERFLGKVITLKAGVAKVEVKPEVKKAGGVFYTPSLRRQVPCQLDRRRRSRRFPCDRHLRQGKEGLGTLPRRRSRMRIRFLSHRSLPEAFGLVPRPVCQQREDLFKGKGRDDLSERGKMEVKDR